AGAGRPGAGRRGPQRRGGPVPRRGVAPRPEARTRLQRRQTHRDSPGCRATERSGHRAGGSERPGGGPRQGRAREIADGGLVLLVPKFCLGTRGQEALLRWAGVRTENSVFCQVSVRRSRASRPLVPKQSLGTRTTRTTEEKSSKAARIAALQTRLKKSAASL